MRNVNERCNESTVCYENDEMMMVQYVNDGSMMMMNDMNGPLMLMTQYVNNDISGSCRRSAIGEYFVSKI